MGAKTPIGNQAIGERIIIEKKRRSTLREPDLMLVVTGGPMAYTRPDGVKVIPLACLKD